MSTKRRSVFIGRARPINPGPGPGVNFCGCREETETTTTRFCHLLPDHPGMHRFMQLAHAPAPDATVALAELERALADCAELAGAVRYWMPNERALVQMDPMHRKTWRKHDALLARLDAEGKS